MREVAGKSRVSGGGGMVAVVVVVMVAVGVVLVAVVAIMVVVVVMLEPIQKLVVHKNSWQVTCNGFLQN